MNAPFMDVLELAADITDLIKAGEDLTISADLGRIEIECGCRECDPCGVIMSEGIDVLEALHDLREKVRARRDAEVDGRA